MAEQKSYVTLTDANFHQEVLESPVPVLVDFWAPRCGPCRAVAPAIEKLAEDYQGKAKVGKLNVDENPIVAHHFSIRSIPTMMFFADGQIVDQQVGAAPRQYLAGKLDSLLKTAA